MTEKKMINAGFKVKRYTKKIEISKNLLNRYRNLPTEYLTFLEEFKEIIDETDTIWFNLNKEFNEQIKTANFRWNEFELMSLEWSEDDNEEIKTITEFWKNHIPILMSVKHDYQFLAICLENQKYGEIVHGREPEFEDVKKICNNFKELISIIEKKELQNII